MASNIIRNRMVNAVGNCLRGVVFGTAHIKCSLIKQAWARRNIGSIGFLRHTSKVRKLTVDCVVIGEKSGLILNIRWIVSRCNRNPCVAG